MSNSASGKLVLSNPASPDSAFTPTMKSVSEVPAFAQEHHAAKAAALENVQESVQVAVYEDLPDYVCTPTHPLIITGSGPVSAKFGTVTIEPGGQILVYTAAEVYIEKLIKK